jgi:hypothetical protein
MADLNKDLFESARIFADFANWLAAATELGEIDPLKDESIMMSLSVGGGSMFISWKHLYQLSAAVGRIAEENPDWIKDSS